MGLKSIIQGVKAQRVYRADPEARAALDRLAARADAGRDLTEEAYLGAERRILVEAKLRKKGGR